MKKLLTLVLSICLLLSFSSFNVMANDNVVDVLIPDYQIIIDDSLVYYADSLYPFLNYKGITYLPMTYEYARGMNLATGYLEGSAFMVSYNPCDDKLPVYETRVNQKVNTAVIPQYKIYVNGKNTSNANAEYPLLNFRGVTYFPMTWEYAVNNFGWDLSFENNVFKIYTENNTADRWSLVEKNKENAVLEFYYAKEKPQSDGTIKYDYITEYYSLDYKTGECTLLNNYVPKDEYFANNTRLELRVDNGDVYYKEQKLYPIHINIAENDYVKPADVASCEYHINAFLTDRHLPLNVVEIDVRTAIWRNDGSGGGTRMTYTYLLVDDKLIYLDDFVSVENAYTLGEDIYFNTVEYAQTISRHYKQNLKMWKLSKDGSLSEITYADYNSIKIIGKANDTLYLKCLWSPENHMDYAPYSVSLVNDGYYTFDGQEIEFVSPYIYSDFDIVSDDGDIIAVNNKLDKITRCEINPEYH
ncbi:MAG: hypothetical protein IKJ68_04525 [Clostridia bacterium]|nr:hypothetical protein [Clostridia bacterium]